MTISVKCSSCGKAYTVRDELAGKQAKCKCGCPMVIPQPDAMQSLLDEELPLADLSAGSPLDALAAGAGLPASGPRPLGKLPAKPSKKGRFNPVLPLGIAGMVVGVILIGLLVFAPNWGGGDSQGEVAQGGATPEEVFENHKRATIASDYQGILNTLTPQGQEAMIGPAVMIAVNMAENDSRMAELLRGHGISETMWKDAAVAAKKDLATAVETKDFQGMIEGAQQRQKTLLAALQDKPAFYVAAMERAEQVGEELMAKMGRPGQFTEMQAKAEEARALTKLVHLTIDGDTAEGKQSMSFAGRAMEIPVHFQRIDGRWYIHPLGKT